MELARFQGAYRFGRPVRGRRPVYSSGMPVFEIAMRRVDRGQRPTVVEALFLTVDWPVMPRDGESLDISEGLDPQTVESVGYDLDGHPTVFVGRVVLDDLEMQLLRKAGWRVTPLSGGH